MNKNSWDNLDLIPTPELCKMFMDKGNAMRKMLLDKKEIPDVDYVEYEEMYSALSKKIEYAFYIVALS